MKKILYLSPYSVTSMALAMLFSYNGLGILLTTATIPVQPAIGQLS
jgi:hypothetical protein